MIAIWLCFAIRLCFYCAMLPVWEGYDEWAHFAVVRRMAFHGEWLVSRERLLPADVYASFSAGPVPWTLRGFVPGALTEEEYWRLPALQKAARRVPPGGQNADASAGPNVYEALQPPLYYWLMSLPMRLMRAASLVQQVYVLRMLSILLASCVGPMIWLLTRSYGAAAIASLMPGLAIDVARVGNESLGILLFTVLTFLVTRKAGRKNAALAGLVLGLGLLTKAYFLTAIPALLLLYLVKRKPQLANAAISMATAFGLAGWWYIRNELTTGTLSGLNEAVALRHASPGDLARWVTEIHWAGAIDSILSSHLWAGGWSFLGARGWMYHLFYALIAASVTGLLFLKDKAALRAPASIYGFFWVGQLYNVALLYGSKGLMGSMGWYMYAVVGAEVLLTLAGLHALAPARLRKWIDVTAAALFALFDLYTVHAVAIPYFNGLTSHRPDGRLSGFPWSDVASLFQTIVFSPPLVFLWMAYFAATVTLVALAKVEFAE